MGGTLRLRSAATILACSAFLAGAAGVVPGAASAAHAGATSCGARSIQFEGGGNTSAPVSRIVVEGGATCAEAVKVIRGALLRKPPAGWTVSEGTYKVPRGLVAQIAVNGHKKVKYATVGPS